MNSAAVKKPDLVKQAAKEFNKEKVTIAIDARRNKEMHSAGRPASPFPDMSLRDYLRVKIAIDTNSPFL